MLPKFEKEHTIDFGVFSWLIMVWVLIFKKESYRKVGNTCKTLITWLPRLQSNCCPKVGEKT
jgi:hypothetical protein